MTNPKIRRPVIVNHLSPEVAAALASHASKPEVINDLQSTQPWKLPEGADVLVTATLAGWKETPADWRAPNSLKWVQVQSTGIEVYPHGLMTNRVITCARGINAVPIAEFVLAAILRLEKKLDETRACNEGDWTHPDIGHVSGRTLGLIGYGTIGQAIASRAQAFGMEILVNRRSAWKTVPDGITPCAAPEAIFAKADHLVLAVPLTADTAALVDTKLLARAKPGLHLINISRGGLVDQDALLDALDHGPLSYASLDVTSPEPLPDGHRLYNHPKVLISPHISWRGGDQDRSFLERLLTNLDAYVEGRELQFVVDVAKGY